MNYLRFDYTPNLSAVALSVAVMGIMVFWPEQLRKRVPGSLIGLAVATAASVALGLDVPAIGEIPQTIVLADRLRPGSIPWENMDALLVPAFSIAALGSIESLLCGTVGGRMTGQRLASGQELIAQGLGNMLIPFFGGVPATAAIARSSVAIKSGGRTRVVSLVHSGVLLLSALLLAPVIARVPLAALAGVLAVTAWRMNEWEEIRELLRRRFASALFGFFSTLVATVVLDLTQAIVLGVGLSAVIFVVQISRLRVILAPVEADKMRAQGYEMHNSGEGIQVVYAIGPLSFGTVNAFNATMEKLSDVRDLILSLRTVPLLDTTGLGALEALIQRVERGGGHVYLSGLNDPVRAYLERAGIIAHLGEEHIFWSAYEAIVAADFRRSGPALG